MDHQEVEAKAEQARLLSIAGHADEALSIIDQILMYKMDMNTLEVQFAALQIQDGREHSKSVDVLVSYALNLVTRSALESRSIVYLIDAIDFLMEAKMYDRAMMICEKSIMLLRSRECDDHKDRLLDVKGINNRIRSIRLLCEK